MFKIPVRIQPLFWLLAGVIGWLSSQQIVLTVMWMAVILVSVLVHEFGHALTARFFGQRASIVLTGFGGQTMRTGKQLSLWQEFIIVFNGPLAGSLLCLVAFLTYAAMTSNSNPDSSMVLYVLTITVWINLFWTIVNLFPVQPLDGGKLLQIIMEGIFGFKGIKIAQFVSVFLGVAIGLVFFSLGMILPGALFFMLAFENFRTLRTTLSMTEKDQDISLWHKLKVAEVAIKSNRGADAEGVLEQLRAETKGGIVFVAATEMLSDILTRRGQYKEAYELLSSVKGKMSPDYLKNLLFLAYKTNDYSKAVKLGAEAFQEAPDYEVALITAYCHALLGEVKPAVGWLQCALREGAPDFQEILKKADFNSIRQDPLFVELEASAVQKEEN